MRLVAYDPARGTFEDFGPIEDQYEICYFHGMTVSPDGTVWTAETDSNRCIVYKCVPRA